MQPLNLIWLQFLLCAALIGFAGYQLSRYAEVIAQRTGLSGSWIGQTTPILLVLYLVAMRTVFAYEREPPVHAVTVGSAITMTGLAMVGLFFRPGGRVLRAISWISLGLMAMYLLNTYVLYLYGE